ncbi:right-handed parallel beta-helix repeat-containing protein [Draconibacterium sp. IB214405]|uniref:right-handed parallel beta-helix repeat-containing protein n=1 Tax=Draconibacterium sp. IB214405 TaxID=3097352 RepID=UPI002A13C7F0|nr:right-handed parallel beta-helix repeat-containing protein [Draconibacterium sp. IB214405]MDX8339284.1 right-handed parallel beta-helix repeat-containing protein [Draconibacterium sp. IB214405]
MYKPKAYNVMKRYSSILNSLFRKFSVVVFGVTLSLQCFATDLSGVNDTIVSLTVAESPYSITGDVTFNAKVNIEAGVVLEFSDDFIFQVNGQLDAEGTEANPIVFRSSTSYPLGSVKLNPITSVYPNYYQASYWHLSKLIGGLEIMNSYELRNFEISECTRGVIIQNRSQVNLKDFTIHDIQKEGIYCNYNSYDGNPVINITGGALYSCGQDISTGNYSAARFYYDDYSTINSTMHVNLENLKIHDNAYYGVYLQKYTGNINATITGCSFTNSASYAIYSYNVPSVNATKNWWGTTDGLAINNMLYGDVSFAPYQTSDGGTLTTHMLQGKFMGSQEFEAGSIYSIVGDYNSQTSDVLAIAPGTVIEFAGNFNFQVNGQLDAEGAEGSPIVFRSSTDYALGSVFLNPVASVYPNYYQASYWHLSKLIGGLEIMNSYELRNFEISECTRGVIIQNRSQVNLKDFTIHDIQKEGIYCNYNSYDGNPVINITGGALYSCGQDISTGNYSAARFYYDDYSTINSTMHVNLENLKIHDNAYYGVYLQKYTGNINATIKNCQVSTNGGNGIHMASSIISNFQNLTSNNNSGDGITFNGSGNSILTNLRLQGNEATGLYINNGGSSLQITQSSINTNSTYDIFNNSTQTINATNNYWNYTDPTIIEERIYDQVDNSSKGLVEYDPYLLEEPNFEPLPADFNVDGNVNGYDLAQFAVAFGSTSENMNWNEACDLNTSGQVDGFDLAIFATYFGQSTLKSTYTHPYYILSNLKSENIAKLTLEADLETLKSENEFSVFVTAEDIQEAIGLAFNVNYNNQMFELLEVVQYNEIESNGESIFLSQIDQDKGNVVIGLASLDNTVNGLNGSGTVCELKFKTKDIKLPLDFNFSDAGLIAMDGKTELELQTNDLSINVTSIDELTDLDVIALSQNYPNPFTEESKIILSIPRGNGESINLALYDITGKKLSVIKEGWLDPGVYEFTIQRKDQNGKRLSGGIYFLKLTEGDVNLQRKVIIR